MIGRLCALGCAIAWVVVLLPRAGQAQSQPSLLDHVQLHVSAALLDELAHQTVDEELVVRDTILGVPVEGRARVTGAMHLRLLPHADCAVFELVLQGKAESETIGRSAPVIIRSEAVTHFTVSKRFSLDDGGLGSQPAVCRAAARSTVKAVETEWPGARGWLVRRIAWRRVQNSQHEADTVASRHAERDLSRSFDLRCGDLIDQVNTVLASRWLRGDASASRRLVFHTSDDRLFAGLTPATAPDGARPIVSAGNDAAVLAVPVQAIGFAQSLQLLSAWLRDGFAGLAHELTGEPLSVEVLSWLAQPGASGPRLSPVPTLADGWFRLTLRPTEPEPARPVSIARRAP